MFPKVGACTLNFSQRGQIGVKYWGALATLIKLTAARAAVRMTKRATACRIEACWTWRKKQDDGKLVDKGEEEDGDKDKNGRLTRRMYLRKSHSSSLFSNRCRLKIREKTAW